VIFRPAPLHSGVTVLSFQFHLTTSSAPAQSQHDNHHRPRSISSTPTTISIAAFIPRLRRQRATCIRPNAKTFYTFDRVLRAQRG
jgi:hypothetical protein